MQNVYLCDGLRTPIGRYAGALSGMRTDDLAAVPLQALMARHPGLDWAALEEVSYGCVNQAGEDNRNVARMATLLAGLPVSVAASTVNRLCGSGLDAVGGIARAIACGALDLAVAGGVESMSRAPLILPKATSAFSRQAEVADSTIGWRFVNPRMLALHGVDSMGETAENVAQEHGIQRADQDAFALRSQQRAAAAQAAGWLAAEITPVPVPGRRGDITWVSVDEHPRPQTSAEELARLKPAFRDGGSVTAGNSSGVNDGAAALLLASEAGATRHGLTPRARVLGLATAGVAPRVMGIGPVPAVRKLLAQTGLSLGDFDLIELNEAFAAQGLAVLRGLGLPDDGDFINPQGGAIAFGHPLGMSGVRLVLTALHQLERTGARRALCTMCVGVGQGIALAIERV
ncbi:3-oxoadipyl-CoA thiolase [Sphaerotilus natans subsp. natans DSM 6575]|uniref:3-oxoadipyl-CoA thiolase n=1 Tax=Sphaerotilus natans subsp. natans DSM 6575 TaxID=1286631 RepID=A0A059KGU6_9BURK|nr:3-oxoadipyl-CoA thiolase [Sphaerotilus natans]KDB50702.1 3-oxoadipyl-CoA thiolase [Sphaerotilus natans subsp. natans DSM 6575]SIS02443.1 3-oxoadipyl-CoA thiolase [Sphaerotilus natans]